MFKVFFPLAQSRHNSAATVRHDICALGGPWRKGPDTKRRPDYLEISLSAEPKSSAKPRSSNPWRQQGQQGAGAKQRKREKRAGGSSRWSRSGSPPRSAGRAYRCTRNHRPALGAAGVLVARAGLGRIVEGARPPGGPAFGICGAARTRREALVESPSESRDPQQAPAKPQQLEPQA